MKLHDKILMVLQRTGIGRARYVYRNQTAIGRDTPDLWCISGYDRISGKRGILEWCNDEADAQAVLSVMRQFSDQFESLHCEQYSSIDWLRTTWDTHY